METKPKLLTKYATAQEQQRVAKHKHCTVCGTPIEITKEFCSDKCRTEHKRYSRGKVRNGADNRRRPRNLHPRSTILEIARRRAGACGPFPQRPGRNRNCVPTEIVRCLY